jgi:hypothetical protein
MVWADTGAGTSIISPAAHPAPSIAVIRFENMVEKQLRISKQLA